MPDKDPVSPRVNRTYFQYAISLNYKEENRISSFGSKFFGWLAALGIILGVGILLLPEGYNTLILWLSPDLGMYIRPTMILISVLIVDPFNNFIMLGIWIGAGLIGGIIAGTKKGAFVVGLFVWLTLLAILAFSVLQLFQSGLDITSLPPMPPGTSIADVLGIPLIQSVFDQVLAMLTGMGSGGLDIMSLITNVLIWVFTPIIAIIVAGMIGATIRPKE